MPRRAPPVCDVPGCGCRRSRIQRLCSACWRKLPGELRVGINEAHYQRRRADWRRLRDRAAAFLNLSAARAPSVSPQRAFELHARLLGER